MLDTLRELPPDTPALGLIDGSLILFGMYRHDEFVRRQLIGEEYVRVLDEIKRMAAERTLAIASYISLPRSVEVAERPAR